MQLTLRTSAASPVAIRNAPRNTVPRTLHPQLSRGRLTIRRALIGDVNDPEKSKQNKRKKERDSEWAEPSNSNPLEKRTVAHGGSEAKPEGEDLGEKAKEAVDKAKDAVKNATSGN